MIKKVCNFMLLFSLLFIMTGCVKFNANMDIKKDKSMKFEIIYALDASYFGEQELFDETEKKDLETKGFVVEDYNNGNMKGVKIHLDVPNIDFISSSEETEFSLSGLTGKDVDKNVFMVKKGLLKNTYKAKLKFDSADGEMDNSPDEEDDLTVDSDVTVDEEPLINEEEVIDDSIVSDDTLDEELDLGMDSLMSALDLSFNVNLPYAAISNNATEVNNDGKTLKWELATDGISYIEFEFELYNMLYIYISICLLLVLLIVVVLLVVKKFKNKKNSGLDASNVNNNLVQSQALNNQVKDTIQQENNVVDMNQNMMLQQNVVGASEPVLQNIMMNPNMQMNNPIPTPIVTQNIQNGDIQQNQNNQNMNIMPGNAMQGIPVESSENVNSMNVQKVNQQVVQSEVITPVVNENTIQNTVMNQNMQMSNSIPTPFVTQNIQNVDIQQNQDNQNIN